MQNQKIWPTLVKMQNQWIFYANWPKKIYSFLACYILFGLNYNFANLYKKFTDFNFLRK